MCLGVPGRVVSVWDDGGTPMGTIDFGGVRKEVCLAFVPEARPGDYAIVHVGFALTRLDERSALETLDLLGRIGMLEAELAAADEGADPERSPGAVPQGSRRRGLGPGATAGGLR